MAGIVPDLAFRSEDNLFSAWPFNLLLDAYRDPEIAARCSPWLLGETILKFPEDERTALDMHYRRGTPMTEIAKAYAVSPSSVRRTIDKAKRRLRLPENENAILATSVSRLKTVQADAERLAYRYGQLEKAFLNLGLDATPDKLFHEDGTPADDLVFASIDVLGLPGKTAGALRAHGISTIGHLIQSSICKLVDDVGLDPSRARDVDGRLRDAGLRLMG